MCRQVISTEVCNGAETLCNSIAPVHNPSKAIVVVKNTGHLTSSYTVSLGSCTIPVVDMAIKSVLSLDPDATSTVTFDVRSLESFPHAVDTHHRTRRAPCVESYRIKCKEAVFSEYIVTNCMNSAA